MPTQFLPPLWHLPKLPQRLPSHVYVRIMYGLMGEMHYTVPASLVRANVVLHGIGAQEDNRA